MEMRYENKVYHHQRIEIAGNRFHNFYFKECFVIYSPDSNEAISECLFDDCRWYLGGKAGSAMFVLRGLHQFSDNWVDELFAEAQKQLGA